MQFICDHIKRIRAPYTNEDLNYQVMECGDEMNMTINDLRKIMNRKIGKTIRNVKVYPENWCIQRKTIISFRYRNLQCEVGEHFGSQRDYLWVRITPIASIR
jgi:hypothetical protein